MMGMGDGDEDDDEEEKEEEKENVMIPSNSMRMMKRARERVMGKRSGFPHPQGPWSTSVQVI